MNQKEIQHVDRFSLLNDVTITARRVKVLSQILMDTSINYNRSLIDEASHVVKTILSLYSVGQGWRNIGIRAYGVPAVGHFQYRLSLIRCGAQLAGHGKRHQSKMSANPCVESLCIMLLKMPIVRNRLVSTLSAVPINRRFPGMCNRVAR